MSATGEGMTENRTSMNVLRILRVNGQIKKKTKETADKWIRIAWIVHITGGMDMRGSHSRLHPAGEAT
jgi:hypothetical protein